MRAKRMDKRRVDEARAERGTDMNWELWVDPRVATVRIDQPTAYLGDHGWEPRPFPRPEILLYEGPLDDDGEAITLWVPASEQLDDYRFGVARIITNLSVFEERHPVQILDDVLTRRTA